MPVLLLLLAGAVCLLPLAEGRLLKQDPFTVATSRGQQPAGVWAMTGQDAEAGAASTSKGIEYNAGDVVAAGDGVPGPLSQGAATDGIRAQTRSCQ